MIVQHPVEVNAVEDDAGAEANRREVGTKVGLEGPPLDAEVSQGFLAVVAAFVHDEVPIQSPSDALRYARAAMAFSRARRWASWSELFTRLLNSRDFKATFSAT